MNEVTTAQTTQRISSFVDQHGKTRVAILCGGVAAVLGTLLPFAHVSTFFGGSASYNLMQSGFYGFLLLIIGALLGAFPIFLKQYSRFQLAAFGLACALCGVFVAIWLASSGIVSAIGSGLGGLSLGFYLLLIGYVTMVIAYYRLASGASN